MLAYAARRPQVGKRQSNPHAMLLVISAHIALVAVVISAKMDLPVRIHHPPTTIINLPSDPAPPPPHPTTKSPPQPPIISIDQPPTHIPLPHLDPTVVDTGPSVNPMPIGAGGTTITSIIPETFNPIPVRHDPKLLTPASELRPPYPPSKLLSEEEATLRLKLTISDSGRVTAVDPVGAADREFLDAARRYLLAHWRYQPATEDGRAVASSTVITLRFQLDG